MSAALSPELERFVEEEVNSDHFASREAAIGENHAKRSE